MLQVSHQLRREMPNQHPFPPMESWGFTIHQPFHAVYDSQHRSVYLMTQRNRRHPYLALFDGADPNQSVAERLPTTTPTQSLYLMNSPFVHQAAEEFAKQMIAQSADERERIEWAYAAALVKQPSTRDVQRAQEFLAQYRESNPDSDEISPWSALARVLITSNPFLMLD